MFDKFAGIAGHLRRFNETAEPLLCQVLRRGVITVVSFINPVRGDAGLGNLMHGTTADLYFHRLAERAKYRCVQ